MSVSVFPPAISSDSMKLCIPSLFLTKSNERSGVSSFIMRTAMVFIECSTATFTVVSPLYLSGRLRG